MCAQSYLALAASTGVPKSVLHKLAQSGQAGLPGETPSTHWHFSWADQQV